MCSQFDMLTVTVVISTVVLFLAIKDIGCQHNEPDKLLDRRCLDCFCEGQTGCNISYSCTDDANVLCGLYQLSYYYWIDGGRLGATTSDHAQEDFRACSNNKLCAEQTIQNYMKFYSLDCNGNGVIDCVDFFRIHRAGHKGCIEKFLEETEQWLRFLECYLNTAPDIAAAFFSLGGTITHR